MLAVLGVAGAGVFVKATSHGETPPSQLSAADASYCALVKTYKTSLGKLTPVSGAAAGDQLAKAVALVDQARDNAPVAIKADMDTFASAYTQVARALANTNFRPDEVGLDALQPLQTPDFDAAIRRIADFDNRTCGIR